MHTFPVREAKNNFSMLLDLVSKGAVVSITKHGQEVAHIVATKLDRTATDLSTQVQKTSALLQEQSYQRSIDKLKRLRAKVLTGDDTAFDWRAARDDGRRV